ncbi:MAG: hypothetical protein ACLFPZ_09155, partial [Rhodosalinus sp.]
MVDLISEEGLNFTWNLLNADWLILVQTRSGTPIVSIPCSSDVNDFIVFMRQGQDADGGFAVFREQVDRLCKEAATGARHICIGPHPHVIGQPFRMRAHPVPRPRAPVRRHLVDHRQGNRQMIPAAPRRPHLPAACPRVQRPPLATPVTAPRSFLLPEIPS